MLLSDLSKIGFSFCFGFLLSPFSWGILYLPIFIIIFGTIDYLFFKGEFTYEYFEHRGGIIFYGILGFIIGRTFHDLVVTPVDNFHKKIPKSELKYSFHEDLLMKDLDFISSIKPLTIVNVNDRSILDSKDMTYLMYRFIVFSHTNDIYNFFNHTINNSLELSSKKTRDKKDIIIGKIKKCKEGLENIKKTYPHNKIFNEKINLLIDKITEIN